jgi:hypothetical protein
MQLQAPPTSFARLNRPWALGLLGLVLVAACFSVGVTLSPWRSGFADSPDRAPEDILLYRSLVYGVHAGDSFYTLQGAELSQRGYPTQSIFNWRLPVFFVALGSLPSPRMGKALLISLGLWLLLESYAWMAREGSLYQALGGVLMMTGAVMPCFLGDLYVMPVVWAGILIGLSVVSAGLGKSRLAFLFAAVAPLVRLLALPYCVLCVGLAIKNRRWREVGFWAVAFALYGGLLAYHAVQVTGHLSPEGRFQDTGWIRWGGAPFVISTFQMNCYLLLLPQWVTGLCFTAALLGIASWGQTAGLRIGLTLSLYAIAFAVAGHDFNQYWGALITPLVCVGVARAPAALRDLYRMATDQSCRTAAWQQRSHSAS